MRNRRRRGTINRGRRPPAERITAEHIVAREQARRRRPAAAPIERQAAAYIDWLLMRHYSIDAVRQVSNRLDIFLRWLLERSLTEASEVSLARLERYQRAVSEERKKNGAALSIGSQLQRLFAVRGFFRFLVRERYLAANPAADLLLPRKPARLPRDVLNREEVELLLAQPDPAQPLGLRDRAWMEFLYSTGLRRAEVVRLALGDVDFGRGTVFVREGKGKKDRVVPVGERALAWLRKYLDETRPQLVCGRDCGEVFLSELGEAIAVGRLSRVMRGYLERSGLRTSGGCHLLRHTMATLMLENGADVRFIQEMLGHTQLSTTAIYTRVSIGKLKEIHTATHPGARLRREAGALAEAEELSLED